MSSDSDLDLDDLEEEAEDDDEEGQGWGDGLEDKDEDEKGLGDDGDDDDSSFDDRQSDVVRESSGGGVMSIIIENQLQRIRELEQLHDALDHERRELEHRGMSNRSGPKNFNPELDLSDEMSRKDDGMDDDFRNHQWTVSDNEMDSDDDIVDARSPAARARPPANHSHLPPMHRGSRTPLMNHRKQESSR